MRKLGPGKCRMGTGLIRMCKGSRVKGSQHLPATAWSYWCGHFGSHLECEDRWMGGGKGENLGASKARLKRLNRILRKRNQRGLKQDVVTINQTRVRNNNIGVVLAEMNMENTS